MEVRRYLRSKINRKIIEFFLENPASLDEPRGIATWINEEVEKTGKALKELAKAKILISHGSSTAPAYGYTTEAHIASKVKSGLKKFKTGKKSKQ